MSDKLKRLFIPGIVDAYIEVDEDMVASAVAEYLREHPVSITVDSELSGTSENPVQNNVIKLALDQKGTYSKPSGGIPKNDLAPDVQSSLEKADTALQNHQSLTGYATETWVEGKGYQTAQQVQTAIAAAAELPTGGSAGDFLRKTASGVAWQTVPSAESNSFGGGS